MKAIFFQILILLVLASLVSCGKSGAGNSGASESKAVQPQEEDKYSVEEMAFGEKLEKCSLKWESLMMKNNESSEASFVTIGIVGRNCLQLENLEALKIVKVAYEQKTENWNELSRSILKMEK